MNFLSQISPLHCFRMGALPALAVLLSSCSDGGSSEITATREISKFERERSLAVDATMEERFRFNTMGMTQVQPGSTTAEAGETSAAGSGGSPQLKWDKPEGWSDAPSASMRDINLSFGPDGVGECYVARLPGAAGGLESNINRWRKQMGQETLSEEEIAGLPTLEVFGEAATYVSIDGSFTGMGGKATIDDARMLGMVLMTQNGALFIKMTGPTDLVAGNTAKFEELCASLRLE